MAEMKQVFIRAFCYGFTPGPDEIVRRLQFRSGGVA